jgi:hypothetical protein
MNHEGTFAQRLEEIEHEGRKEEGLFYLICKTKVSSPGVTKVFPTGKMAKAFVWDKLIKFPEFKLPLV